MSVSYLLVGGLFSEDLVELEAGQPQIPVLHYGRAGGGWGESSNGLDKREVGSWWGDRDGEKYGAQWGQTVQCRMMSSWHACGISSAQESDCLSEDAWSHSDTTFAIPTFPKTNHTRGSSVAAGRTRQATFMHSLPTAPRLAACSETSPTSAETARRPETDAIRGKKAGAIDL